VNRKVQRISCKTTSGRQVQYQHFMLHDQELNNKRGGGSGKRTNNTSVRTEYGASRNPCTHLLPSEALPGRPKGLCLTPTTRTKRKKKKRIGVTWVTVTGMLPDVAIAEEVGSRYKVRIQPQMAVVVLFVRYTLGEAR